MSNPQGIGLESPQCAANRQPRTIWSTCEVGHVWVIPDWQQTRADICTNANKVMHRTGRRFKCTATEGGTRVERII